MITCKSFLRKRLVQHYTKLDYRDFFLLNKTEPWDKCGLEQKTKPLPIETVPGRKKIQSVCLALYKIGVEGLN